MLDTAGLLLFIFYAVSFTKTPFGKLIKDNEWQTWAIRLWALVLGIVGALVDTHFGGNASWTGPQVYDAVKAGGAAAVGAIITYHIGNGDFIGVFDSGTQVVVSPTKPPTAEIVKPVTPAIPIAANAANAVPTEPPPLTFTPYTPPKDPNPVTPAAANA